MLTLDPITPSPRYARCAALEPVPNLVFLTSTKLPTLVRERSDRGVTADRDVGDHAVIEQLRAVADRGVNQANAAVDHTGRSDHRVPFQEDSGMDDRIGANLDRVVDV